MSSTSDSWSRLAGRLRELRQAAGFTGISLAATLGWTQSKVSKIETGRTLPKASDVMAWAQAVRVGADEVRTLVDLAGEARAEQDHWRSRFRGGQAEVQQGYAELAQQSTVVRNFEPAAMPGLVQTADYARYRIMEGVRRHGADPAGVDAAIAERMRRQQVLYDPAKRFEFLLGEPALWWRLAPDAVLRGQFDRLLTLQAQSNITIAVLPFAAPLDDTPISGFVLFDGVGRVETTTRDVVAEGEDSATYAAIFADYMRLAATGDEARRHILSAIGRINS